MRIAVIGAGVVGSLIARELARYDAEILLFDREVEVGFGVTKANSGIIHAGFHDEPGTLRARFCILGNAIYSELAEELEFSFRRTGALVLAFNAEEEETLKRLWEQGEANGVPGLALLSKEEVLAKEPEVNPAVRAGLFAPTVGITAPWEVAQAAAENAQENGAEFHLGEEVLGVEVKNGRVQALRTQKGPYFVDAIVNAAGLFADRISEMAGVPFPTIIPRRGEYILLDEPAGNLVHSVLFPTPSPVSKGILVIPTVDGGLLLGPTAEDLPPKAKEATETTSQGLSQVIREAGKLVPKIPLNQALKTFAGLRPEPENGDFVVGPTKVRGFYQAGGMRSPGLTAAPAIAQFLAPEVIAPELSLKKKTAFNPKRARIPRAAELSQEEWEKLIREDPRWGRIVCFCNTVTEAEVVEAIRRGARTLDGVKFRTRAGFGRCQGSFCAAKIMAILARELGFGPERITLRGPGSELIFGKVRP